jgi:hypothetical protein
MAPPDGAFFCDLKGFVPVSKAGRDYFNPFINTSLWQGCHDGYLIERSERCP